MTGKQAVRSVARMTMHCRCRQAAENRQLGHMAYQPRHAGRHDVRRWLRQVGEPLAEHRRCVGDKPSSDSRQGALPGSTGTMHVSAVAGRSAGRLRRRRAACSRRQKEQTPRLCRRLADASSASSLAARRTPHFAEVFELLGVMVRCAEVSDVAPGCCGARHASCLSMAHQGYRRRADGKESKPSARYAASATPLSPPMIDRRGRRRPCRNCVCHEAETCAAPRRFRRG